MYFNVLEFFLNTGQRTRHNIYEAQQAVVDDSIRGKRGHLEKVWKTAISSLYAESYYSTKFAKNANFYLMFTVLIAGT